MNRFGKMIPISMVMCVVLTLCAGAEGNDIDQMIRENRMGELTIKAKPGAGAWRLVS